MGYTHYWNVVRDEKTPDFYNLWAQGVRTIIEKAIAEGIEIGDGMGEEPNKWTVDEGRVWFNGVGPDAHETFGVAPTSTGFNFCKTAQKPYDVVVTACLIHMKKIYTDNVAVSSDGNWHDWQDGAALYYRALGDVPTPPWTTEFTEDAHLWA